jgi:ABC-2 type transport system permease protein
MSADAGGRTHQEAEPTTMVGPSALGGDLKRFVYLSGTLAVTDFKLRFFGSFLGYLWQLMRPLMLFGVLYFVFTEFVRLGGGVPFYPVVLLTNIVLFLFFAEATGGAVGSVVDREGLVRKIQFPRMAIPVSVVITACFNLLLNSVVILIFALASGLRPHAGWLLFPVIVLLLATFAIGMAMLLSALYVRFRDIKPIWEVTLQIIFYASPIIWVIDLLDKAQWVREGLMTAPVAAIMQSVRHYVIDPTALSPAQAAGGTGRLLIPLGIIFGAAIIGFWYFNREAPRVAEEL